MDENASATEPPTPGLSTTYQPVPPKKGSKKTIMAIAIIIVAVVILAAIGIMMMNGSDKVKSTAGDMILKQADFPSGWHTSGHIVETPQTLDDDWSYSVHNNSVSGSESMVEVECQVFTYKSVANAKADFPDMLEDMGSNLTEVSGHFDQCRLWALNYGDILDARMYVFQEKNVCGLLVFTSYSDHDLDQAWIDEMLNLQETKIV